MTAPSRRWSLRRRLGALLAAVTVIVTTAGVVVVVVLVRLSNVQALTTDHLDPADLTASDLFAALVDEETGVRGFVLKADPSFLQPWNSGRAEEATDLARLRRLLPDEPTIARQIEDLETAAEAWRVAFAYPVVQGRPGAADLIDVGKERFDRVRGAYDDVRTSLTTVRRDARDRLRTAETALEIAGGVTGVVLIATAIVLWLSLRRWVLEPIESLGGDVRRVAAGELHHPVPAVGTPETVQLGSDVEAMRERLVIELQNLEVARAELERTAAELQRSNTDLEQFAYVASHDLQEPLRKIASFTQLLQERYAGQLDERADTYIAFAVDGAKRMQRLISDLLGFSRVGRSTNDFQPVDLETILADALRTLSEAIGHAGAEVISTGLPAVQGDPVLLTQLLQNLVGNAVKFRSPDRSPRIELGARREGALWQLWCADNGIGIDPQYAQRVFVIFQRLHGRDEYSGTGIGLALCKKIVEFHGGTIDVETADSAERPHGTTISWTLAPAAPEELGAAPVPAEQEQP